MVEAYIVVVVLVVGVALIVTVIVATFCIIKNGRRQLPITSSDTNQTCDNNIKNNNNNNNNINSNENKETKSDETVEVQINDDYEKEKSEKRNRNERRNKKKKKREINPLSAILDLRTMQYVEDNVYSVDSSDNETRKKEITETKVSPNLEPILSRNPRHTFDTDQTNNNNNNNNIEANSDNWDKIVSTTSFGMLVESFSGSRNLSIHMLRRERETWVPAGGDEIRPFFENNNNINNYNQDMGEIGTRVEMEREEENSELVVANAPLSRIRQDGTKINAAAAVKVNDLSSINNNNNNNISNSGGGDLIESRVEELNDTIGEGHTTRDIREIYPFILDNNVNGNRQRLAEAVNQVMRGPCVTEYTKGIRKIYSVSEIPVANAAARGDFAINSNGYFHEAEEEEEEEEKGDEEKELSKKCHDYSNASSNYKVDQKEFDNTSMNRLNKNNNNNNNKGEKENEFNVSDFLNESKKKEKQGLRLPGANNRRSYLGNSTPRQSRVRVESPVPDKDKNQNSTRIINRNNNNNNNPLKESILGVSSSKNSKPNLLLPGYSETESGYIELVSEVINTPKNGSSILRRNPSLGLGYFSWNSNFPGYTSSYESFQSSNYSTLSNQRVCIGSSSYDSAPRVSEKSPLHFWINESQGGCVFSSTSSGSETSRQGWDEDVWGFFRGWLEYLETAPLTS